MIDKMLKVCPFCGCTPWGSFGPAEGGDLDGYYWIECHGCHGRFCFSTKSREANEAAWNTRPESRSLLDLVPTLQAVKDEHGWAWKSLVDRQINEGEILYAIPFRVTVTAASKVKP